MQQANDYPEKLSLRAEKFLSALGFGVGLCWR